MFEVDVCLAVPPFHTLHHPPLGAPVLKQACANRGLKTRVVYGGFALAKRTGLDAYEEICRAIKHPKIGDRLFRRFAYSSEVLARVPEPEPLVPSHQASFDAVTDSVGPALDEFVAEVLALHPRILGISSCFEQNLASAALARRVRAQAPEICIVMGGANVAWPMARGLAEVFPFVDHFFAGESDVDFPDFCERMATDGERRAERIIRSEPVQDMRLVCPPDFTDFFEGLRELKELGLIPPWMPRFLMMETSRGCWWGAKQHCTFCGLNSNGMEFRQKSAERVLEEIDALSRWNVQSIRMADNIMPMQYFKTLLPKLAEREPRPQVFYEVKANLTEVQVDALVLAGVYKIQPGIESLSSDVLRLMRKGVTSHQNIALLRSSAGVGLRVLWNIIYGFPGEKVRDYESVVALIPLIEHLQPPDSTHEIMIDRYSPLFNDPEGMGIGALEPFSAYRAFYPVGAPLRDIAYHFSANYSTEVLGNAAILLALHSAVDRWEMEWERRPPPVLQVFPVGGGSLILDTRRIARQTFTHIASEQDAALRMLESARSRADLDPGVAGQVDWLLKRDFLIEHDGKLLSVVVRPRAETARTLNLAPGAVDLVDASA